MPTLHLTIKGKVQGVFYRASAKANADELGVSGWIKNTAEGDVEAMVTGSEEQLQVFVKWCKKGPPGASVLQVLITKQEETAFESFSVIR